jgi:CheY-like chemotaxis protein
MSTNLGYQVTLAFDGSEALASLSRDQFDLIILDWNMPVMTGRDLLESLDKKSTARPVNIILYSGNELRYESMPEGKSFRIVDVWDKPLRAADMLRRMKQLREKLWR